MFSNLSVMASRQGGRATAQVASCLVCGAPAEGVWGLPAPAGCGAEPCCFFPAWDHASEAGVIPCRFFPFTFPWTKSMGLNSFNCPGSRTQESYGAPPPTRMSVGRNGHDGSAGTSPDPLLLAPDPMSGFPHIRHDLDSYQLTTVLKTLTLSRILYHDTNGLGFDPV